MSEQEKRGEPSIEEIITGRKPANGAPFSTALALAGLALCVYGFALVSAQCLYWLQNDVWISLSTYDVLVGHPLDVPSVPSPLVAELTTKRVPLPLRLIPGRSDVDRGNAGWLEAPHSWYGLHTVVANILKLLPLSLLSLAAGVLIVIFAGRYA